MQTQNLYEMFSSDPVEANKKFLKAKLAVSIVAMIRANGWNQKAASEHLNVSQPRVSNIVRGRLEKFSIDTLIEMFLRMGYKVEADVHPNNESLPFSMGIKKAML
mgnify:CR=1 FL=1